VKGYSRHRPDFYVPNQRPKRLCVLALAPQDAPAAVAIQNGVLPLNPPQVRSLFEVLRQAPDPRAKNTQFRIGAVLTLIAMAILAGARDVAQIARFATRLHPKQRAALGLPRKAGTKGFYRVPGYNVFYQVLSRLDAEALAQRLSDWLQGQSGQLPAALALDGKMIRDQVGLVSLADHEDGSPVAVALMDQKEGTQRCEQTAALSLLESLPTLEQKVVSADALHCQKATARVIVEKGGEYLLQIKANQPALLQQAEAAGAVSSPLLPRPTADMDGSKSAA
jgi:DDE_Tnp_1-associated